jgi:MoaA/NifB/PqqE/SkfB family radical SAM enzyme
MADGNENGRCREWINEFNPFNSMKGLRWGDHLEQARRWIDAGGGELLPPVVVNLDVAGGRCNFNCPHCHHSYMIQDFNKKLTIVPKDILMQIPKFLHEWGVKASCIVGTTSDATLNPYLPELLKDMHNWNIDVGLVSNGYKFNERLINHTAFYTKFVGFSIDAGTSETFAKVKGVDGNKFNKVVKNLENIAKIVDDNGLRKDVGYKFLILPKNYLDLAKAAKIAKDIGCSYMQIRPAQLPDSERIKIDIDKANELITEAQKLNDENFQVVGVRHKFSPELSKIVPEKCYMTPLTSTWTADGDIWPCVDRRHYKGDSLGNYIKDGLNKVKEMWGSSEHWKIINHINGTLNQCIRCSNYGYNKLFKVVSEEDPMDVRLI